MLQRAHQIGQQHACDALGLTKEAVSRTMKYLRGMLETGANPAQLEASARIAREGALRKVFTHEGTGLRHLGQGSEGIADVVVHPEHGLSVRKAFDPELGMSAPNMIARKEIAGSLTRNNPAMAQFYGAEKAPGGVSTHYNEYIPGKQAPEWPAATPVERIRMQRTRMQTNRALQDAGFAGGGQDVRPANMVIDKRTNMPRTIDYLPAHAGEFAPPIEGKSNLVRTTSPEISGELFNPRAIGIQTPIPEMQRRMQLATPRPRGVSGVVPQANERGVSQAFADMGMV